MQKNLQQTKDGEFHYVDKIYYVALGVDHKCHVNGDPGGNVEFAKEAVKVSWHVF